jgi:NadR type nicotinamide-nucleotide adenylyltransferase
VASIPRRIVLTGSESTGKSTLAAALATRLDTIWVPEFARSYALARAARLTGADAEPIARGQLAAERAALAERDGPVIFDTDLVSTALYARHYYGFTLDWLEAEIRGAPSGLYLLCDIDLEWTSDPVRDRGDRRAHMHRLFEAELERRKLSYRVVRGIGPARAAAAYAALGLTLDDVIPPSSDR